MGILQARLKRSTILEVSENFRITIIVNATPLINLDYKILFAGVSNPSVTESLLQFLKKLIYRFIMFLVTGCSFFYSFGLFCNSVDVSRSVHAYCLERSPSLLFSQIPGSVSRVNHVFLQFYLLVFQICVGLVFFQVCFSCAQFLLSRFIVFLFNTYYLQVRRDLGAYLIPSNQDVVYFFNAFDSFPVT